MPRNNKIDRRRFIGTTAAASLAMTILPRHVIGGKGRVAPSDQLTIAYIGCGSQGLREMAALIETEARAGILDRTQVTTESLPAAYDEALAALQQAFPSA